MPVDYFLCGANGGPHHRRHSATDGGKRRAVHVAASARSRAEGSARALRELQPSARGRLRAAVLPHASPFGTQACEAHATSGLPTSVGSIGPQQTSNSGHSLRSARNEPYASCGPSRGEAAARRSLAGSNQFGCGTRPADVCDVAEVPRKNADRPIFALGLFVSLAPPKIRRLGIIKPMACFCARLFVSL